MLKVERVIRRLHVLLSDAPFLKVPVRWVRNVAIGDRSWQWKLRDAVSDLSRLSRQFDPSTEIRVGKSGPYAKLVDGFDYDFDINPANTLPGAHLRGTSAVDAAELRYIAERVRPDSVVVDAGAGIGEYAMHFAKLGYKVHCFEPMEAWYKRLVTNLQRNDLHATCNQLAVWDKTGSFGLTALDDDDNRLVPLGATNISEVIKATRLDDYFEDKGIGKVDFLKADIQGGELQMLKGLGQFMDSRPALLLEIVPRCTRKMGYEPKDLFDYLERLGYGYVGFYENGVVSKDHYSKLIPDVYNFYFEVLSQTAPVQPLEYKRTDPEVHAGALSR